MLFDPAQATQTLNTPEAADEGNLNAGFDGEDPLLMNGGPFDANETAAALMATSKTLQNDDIFQDPIVPGEVPDLKEDSKLIGMDVAAIESLRDLVKDVRSAGGMYRTIAAEAENIDPGMMKVPMGYFTAEPSATRLKVSMETLLAKIWEFIKKALAKIRAALSKVIGWITGKEAKDANAERAALKQSVQAAQAQDEAAQKATEAVEDAAIKFAHAANSGVDVKDGAGTTRYTGLDRVIGEIMGGGEVSDKVRAYMQGQDPIFNDFVYQGAYFKTITGINHALMTVIGALQAKCHAIEQTLSKMASNPDNPEPVSKQALDSMTEPLRARVNGHEDDLSAIVTKAHEARGNLGENKRSGTLDFQDVFSRLNDAFRTKILFEINRFIGNAGEMLIDANETLRKTDKALEDLAGQHQAESDIDWHRIIHSVQSDLTQFTALLAIVKEYRAQVNHMVSRSMDFAYEVAAEVSRKLASEQPNVELPAVIKQLQEEAMAASKLLRRQAI
jgi:hypothetical protein